ncbi:MAG: 4Fe-4S binding protein [Rickettsiales bacterium]|jgi:NADH-quinone oxidoreductase subunit G|nr:4Fe-4S binding protein [Rickettsiales bacterium]
MTEKKGNSVEFEKSRCIKCTKCVLRCSGVVGIGHLAIKGEGKEKYIDFIQERPCTNCGQCTLVCPVNAMREQSSIDDVKKQLADTSKIVIAQCAPSVRSSLNEIFKIEHSSKIEKKLNSCFRLLGFKKVFDVNFGADITSIVEADELLERIEENVALPMFTSCCPSWVNFVKKYRPQLLENLTTALSPQIHAGFAYKTWWAEKETIDPKNIVVVSIMPCTSKKDEIESFRFKGLKAVDYVLTVRELAKLIEEGNVDFAGLEESDGDALFNYSGGAVIYGKSGGVMESAIRVIKRKIENKSIDNFYPQEVNENGIFFKESTVNIGSRTIKIAIIATPKNLMGFIDSGKYKEYHYIEVMNCPGGCLGGGGQPLLPAKPALEAELLQKRRELLQNLDNNNVKRNALENENAIEYLNWVSMKNLREKLLLASVD